jgi:hypothetical protein
VGGQRHAPAASPPGKTQYPVYRRLGGPQGRSGRMRKILPSPRFDVRTVQPVASRYTDWAIPALDNRGTSTSIKIWPSDSRPLLTLRWLNPRLNGDRPSLLSVCACSAPHHVSRRQLTVPLRDTRSSSMTSVCNESAFLVTFHFQDFQRPRAKQQGFKFFMYSQIDKCAALCLACIELLFV